MKSTSADRYTKKFDFTLNDKKGSVEVEIVANEDVETSGYSAIEGNHTDEMVRGFPVTKAKVHYSGFGYEAVFGWVQIVTHKYGDKNETDHENDIPPAFQNQGHPFSYFGYKPTLYDAPSRELDVDLIWTAYSFLCPVRLVDSRNEKIVSPVVGFSWGFTISGGKLEGLLHPQKVTHEKWMDLSGRISKDLPDWNFI